MCIFQCFDLYNIHSLSEIQQFIWISKPILRQKSNIWWIIVSIISIWLCYGDFLWRIAAGEMHALQWRHNWRDSISNHQPHDCLLNPLFRRRLKKTSKLRVTGLFAGNSPVTGEFPTQMASNAENVSIWWRHHVCVFHGVMIWIHSPHYRPYMVGFRWVSVTKSQYIGASMLPLSLTGRTNSPIAGDLKRHYAHVTSLYFSLLSSEVNTIPVSLCTQLANDILIKDCPLRRDLVPLAAPSNPVAKSGYHRFEMLIRPFR